MNAMADDLLNGSDSTPRYGIVDASINDRPSAVGSTSAAPSGNPRAVMIAWVVLVVLLVAAHVLTLKVQK